MTFSFHPEAESELEDAASWYEERQAGLGLDFLAEAHAAIQRIVRHPVAWPVLEGDVRRALVHRFPYGVLYGLLNGEVFVLAVMHLHRRPGYWQDRMR